MGRKGKMATEWFLEQIISFHLLLRWEAADDLGLMCVCVHVVYLHFAGNWSTFDAHSRNFGPLHLVECGIEIISVWSHAYIGCIHIWCKSWYALPVITSIWFVLRWVRNFDISEALHSNDHVYKNTRTEQLSARVVTLIDDYTFGMYPIWLLDIGNILMFPKRCSAKFQVYLPILLHLTKFDHPRGEAFQNYVISSPDLFARNLTVKRRIWNPSFPWFCPGMIKTGRGIPRITKPPTQCINTCQNCSKSFKMQCSRYSIL